MNVRLLLHINMLFERSSPQADGGLFRLGRTVELTKRIIFIAVQRFFYYDALDCNL